MYDTIMRMSDLFYSHLLISVPLLPAVATIYVLPMLLASERRHKHVNQSLSLTSLQAGPSSAGLSRSFGRWPKGMK
jgi:hypothetical protein